MGFIGKTVKKFSKEELKKPTSIFLPKEEIVADIIKNMTDIKTQKMIASDFTPNPTLNKSKTLSIIMFKSEFMRNIRNHYNLWDEKNPYLKRDLESSEYEITNGVITDPMFPDNFSSAIIDEVIKHFKAIHPDVKYCDF